jgi:hypothetical protein
MPRTSFHQSTWTVGRHRCDPLFLVEIPGVSHAQFCTPRNSEHGSVYAFVLETQKRIKMNLRMVFPTRIPPQTLRWQAHCEYRIVRPWSEGKRSRTVEGLKHGSISDRPKVGPTHFRYRARMTHNGGYIVIETPLKTYLWMNRVRGSILWPFRCAQSPIRTRRRGPDGVCNPHEN